MLKCDFLFIFLQLTSSSIKNTLRQKSKGKATVILRLGIYRVTKRKDLHLEKRYMLVPTASRERYCDGIMLIHWD